MTIGEKFALAIGLGALGFVCFVSVVSHISDFINPPPPVVERPVIPPTPAEVAARAAERAARAHVENCQRLSDQIYAGTTADNPAGWLVPVSKLTREYNEAGCARGEVIGGRWRPF